MYIQCLIMSSDLPLQLLWTLAAIPHPGLHVLLFVF